MTTRLPGSETNWDSYRVANVQSSARITSFIALDSSLQRRRLAAASPLGQHRSQKSQASPVLYVQALAAPFTIDTMPEGTLKALAEETQLGSIMAADGGDCEQVLAEFTAAGIDIDALAEQLQDEGTKSFAKSWESLMAVIALKRESGTKAA